MIYKNVISPMFMFLALPVIASAASLAVSPSSQSVTVGQIFTVSVILNTSGQAIDGTDITYLNFNPALLQVEDDNTSLSGIQITPGLLMPITVSNSADNALGRIQLSQVAAGGTSFNGQGTLASIRFRALVSGTASVTFNFTAGNTQDTNVAAAGVDLLTSVTNGSYTILAPDTTAPNTPTGLNATAVSTTQINLSWNASTDPTVAGAVTSGVAGYHIYRSIGAGNTSPSAFSLFTSVSGTTFSNTNLTPGTVYNYQVVAFDVANNGSFATSPVTATTQTAFDFSIANGGAKTVIASQSIANTVTATLIAGISQSSTFSVSGLPSGASGSFSPATCTPTCSTVLTISTASSVTGGNYLTTVTAVAGGLTRTSSFTLTILIPLAGDLNLDRVINSIDFSIMNGVWLTNNATSDLNKDGTVNSLDFSILNRNWMGTY